MIPDSNNDFRKKLLGICLLFLFSFSFSPVCHATINKSSVSVLVSTTSQDDWYDDRCGDGVDNDSDGKVDKLDPDCDGGSANDTLLNTFLVCDEVYAVYDTTAKINDYKEPFPRDLHYVPCDRDNTHDDYYSTDTADEIRTYPPAENFTIKASASASSGSITATKIEWIGSVTGTPVDATWTSAAVSSFTCANTGTCTVCVEGGSCANDVLPKAYLGVYPDTGAQRRLFFRAVFTDSSANTVVMGQDDTLDKFYRLVICGPACSVHTCDMHAPDVAPASVTPAANLCNGLNDTDGFYLVNWQYLNLPLTANQNYYKVSLREAGTTTVLQSYEASAAATSFKIPSSWVAYGKSYEWQVQVKFTGESCNWDVTSPWSSAGTNIVVPARYPVPSFTVLNPTSVNCLAGGCLMAENITLNGSASTNYTGGATYAWTMDGVAKSGVSFTQSFATKPHTAKLTVTDTGGRSCSLTKSFTLGDAAPVCTATPAASISSVFSPSSANMCGGLNDTTAYYALTWSTSNIPAGASQTAYTVSVRDTSTGVVKTATATSSSTMFQVPTSWLSYNKTYDWKVDVTIAGGGCTYNISSPWSSGATNIVVPVQYPSPVVSVKNASNTDCFAASGCRLGENINFNGGGSVSYAGGGLSYNWNLDGASNTNATFAQSFVTKPHTVGLTVTDTLGRSCTRPATAFSLGDPICAAGMMINSAGWQRTNLCSGINYMVNWGSTLLPAGSVQTHYDITVRDKNNIADSHTRSVDDYVQRFYIPQAWLGYNKTYEWQVTVTYVSADGLCTWTLTLPFSSSPNFSIGHCFPTPGYTVKNSDNVDCLAGGCNLLEEVTFDASSSSACVGIADYTWVLDGTTYTGPSFVKKFTDANHDFTLKVKDADGYFCTSSSINLDFAKSHAQWNEVAPTGE